MTTTYQLVALVMDHYHIKWFKDKLVTSDNK